MKIVLKNEAKKIPTFSDVKNGDIFARYHDNELYVKVSSCAGHAISLRTGANIRFNYSDRVKLVEEISITFKENA